MHVENVKQRSKLIHGKPVSIMLKKNDESRAVKLTVVIQASGQGIWKSKQESGN